MKARVTFFFVLICLVSSCITLGQQRITLPSLLKQMTDFETVAKFPSPLYTLRQASSYDRRSVSPNQPGWFANSDFNQFIREEKKEGHIEWVMMDAEGPGAIVRFWLTTLVKTGMLRFYFDNETKASIEINGFDLLRYFKLGPGLLNPHSSYEPNGKGGNTLYLPLLYQQHCKVTWENTDTSAVTKPHYYQVNYRTYGKGTRVETFKADQLNSYKVAIDKTEKALWNPHITESKKIEWHKNIPAGKSAVWTLPAGSNAIRLLKAVMHPGKQEDDEKMWRNVILKIEFDGLETINCPLGDFIGSGYGGKKISSWFRDLSERGELSSRWFMPYRQTSKITLLNNNDFSIEINGSVSIDRFQWDEKTMYFHASYKFEQNIRDEKWSYDPNKISTSDSSAPIDWNFSTIVGKGVYMGNTLAVYNHMKSWYGEGDAKAYVDNEKFPSEFGTGLEDYYNTSWAPVVLYQTPFANAPRADLPSSYGHNTFTRTRILDAIPFQKAFSFDMEMLSWDGGTIDAGATTYWYGLPGSKEKKK